MEELLKVLWEGFHWENFSRLSFLKIDFPDEKTPIVILTPKGNQRIPFNIGIMNLKRSSKIFSLEREISDGPFGILGSYPCYVFAVPTIPGSFQIKGLGWRRRYTENQVSLKWDGNYYKREASEIKSLDIYPSPDPF